MGMLQRSVLVYALFMGIGFGLLQCLEFKPLHFDFNAARILIAGAFFAAPMAMLEYYTIKDKFNSLGVQNTGDTQLKGVLVQETIIYKGQEKLMLLLDAKKGITLSKANDKQWILELKGRRRAKKRGYTLQILSTKKYETQIRLEPNQSVRQRLRDHYYVIKDLRMIEETLKS